MWKNVVERDSLQMTKWRMRIACWIPKATNTHSSCVILIAFPLQLWLQERASSFFIRTLPVLFIFRFVRGPAVRQPPPHQPFDAPMFPTFVEECYISASLNNCGFEVPLRQG